VIVEPTERSLAKEIELFDAEQAARFLRFYEALSPREQLEFQHSWKVLGRPSQQAPDDCREAECGCGGRWTTWLILCGRGWGKTRTGSEWVHDVAFRYPGCRIAIIARTAGAARMEMIEGVSGVLATEKPWNTCVWEPTKTQIAFKNGTICGVFSADEPKRLRGPQHHFVWCDELAAWDKDEAVWNQMLLGLRLPRRAGWPDDYRPQVVATTTPVQSKLICQLAGVYRYGNTKTKDATTHITAGTTYDNADNLDPAFYDRLTQNLEGTRLGRQELMGEILADTEGALWASSMIDPFRIAKEQLPKSFKQVVVAVDPSAGGENETGIIVVGSGPEPGGVEFDDSEEHKSVASSLRRNYRVHGYILEDASISARKKDDRQLPPTPDTWARAAVRAYHDWGATCIVAESNQGGDMVKYAINTVDSVVPVRLVHATRQKKTRAEPIVALFEQGRVHMVGTHGKLEDQLLTWDPDRTRNSPDRLDAMVWGLHHLLGKGKIHSPANPIEIGRRPSPWAFAS
jgi:phage terminase large subunit-like protein